MGMLLINVNFDWSWLASLLIVNHTFYWQNVKALFLFKKNVLMPQNIILN